jgi:hypothetical protein
MSIAMENSEFRKATIETLRSVRDVVGTVRTGHVDDEPRAGSMFYVYRENGKFMRTNIVKQILSQFGGEGYTVYEFETDSGSQYRVKIDRS